METNLKVLIAKKNISISSLSKEINVSTVTPVSYTHLSRPKVKNIKLGYITAFSPRASNIRPAKGRVTVIIRA